MQSLFNNFQVLSNCLLDLGLSNVDDLIVGWHIPEMLLVAALNGSFRPWQVLALLHDLINNLLKLVLNFLECHSKLDLVLALINVKLY